MGNATGLVAAVLDEDGAGKCCRLVQGPSRESSIDSNFSVDQPREAMIIFDWDDTLMCSSEIKAHRNPDPEEMRQLEDAVDCVLRTAMSLGKTTIVTNANLCWVRATATLFMPSVLAILQFIDIVSARQSYERHWPGNPGAWKRQAFRDVVGSPHRECCSRACIRTDLQVVSPGYRALGLGANQAVNLTVLGDSAAEMQAGQSAVRSQGDADSIIKTVKFKELPTARELLGQLRAVARDLQQVVAEERSVHKHLVHGSLSGWTVRDEGCEASLLSFL